MLMIALTALAEQLFDIAERKRVPKVPAHGAKNQFGLRACRHLKIAARTAFLVLFYLPVLEECGNSRTGDAGRSVNHDASRQDRSK